MRFGKMNNFNKEFIINNPEDFIDALEKSKPVYDEDYNVNYKNVKNSIEIKTLVDNVLINNKREN